MRYRSSITYYLWSEKGCCFKVNDFLYYDKFISQTVALKMLHQEVAFVAGTLEDYVWTDRVI